MTMTQIKRLQDKYRPLFSGLLLFILCLSAQGQTYNPSTCCTVSNKSYGAAQAVSTDGRSWFYDATNFVMRDYNGTTEVFSYLNLAKYRSGHFPIFVHSGGVLQSNGVWLGGTTLVYWFKDSTGNANLVRWYTDSTGVSGGPFFAVANHLSEGNAGLIKGTLSLDLVDNTSDATKNAAAVSLTNHTIDGNNNTLLNIANSSLAHSTIGLSLNNTGATPQVTTTPAALGSSLVLAVPWANGSDSGFLRGTDWSFFHGKLDSVRISNDSVYNCVNGTCTLQSVIAGTGGVNSVNPTNASLIFSPTTGNVLGQVNPAFAFNWTGQHTFNSFAPIFSTLTTGGGLFYGDGFGQLLETGAGTSGQILESTGGTAPTYFTPDATTVSGWLGYTPLSAALGSTKIYVGNGSNVATGVNVSQDISLNNTGAVTVVGFRGRPVAATVPTNGQVYTYNSGSTQWEPNAAGLPQIYAKKLPLKILGTDTVALEDSLIKAPEQDYGLVYSRTPGTFGADWASVGNAVATLTSGNLDISSLNSGTAGNYLYLFNYTDSNSQLSRDSINAAFKVTTTGTGIGFGTKTVNQQLFSGDYFAWINTTSSPATISLLNSPGGIGNILQGPVTGPAFSTGDTLEINAWFADSLLKGTVRNVTTGSSTATITFNYSSLGTPLTPVIGKHAIYTLGGTQRLYKYSIYSKTQKYATLMGVADSKGIYDASKFNLSWINQLNNTYPTAVTWAGGGDETIDIGKGLNQIIKLSPYQVILCFGSNDLRYGRTLAQTIATYDSIVSVLNSYGITVFHLVMPEDSTAALPPANGLTALKNYIAAKYSATYIDVWTGMSTSNVLKPMYNAGDGIHPNQAGHDYVAAQVVVSGLIQNYTNAGRIFQIRNVDKYLRLTGNGQLGVDINQVKQDAGLPVGITNSLPVYSSPVTITNSGFTDDRSTEFGGGNWYTTPVWKAGPSHVVTGALYTMSFNNSTFTNFYTLQPGGGTNDKLWGWNNTGPAYSLNKLLDGGTSNFTAVTFNSSGTTYSNASFGSRVLANGAADDGVTGGQFLGGLRADKAAFGGTSAPVSDAYLFLSPGDATHSQLRFGAGPNKTTTFGGTFQYATGADTSFFVGITRNNLNVLTRMMVMDSSRIVSGRIPFANAGRYYTDDASLTYNATTGMAMTKPLTMSNVPTGFAATTLLAHMPDSSVAQVGIGTGLSVDGSGNLTSRLSHTIFTPTTGGTVNLVNNQYNIVNPAGAIVALTVNLPSSPANNDIVYIKYTQAITTVTYANGTVVDGITAPTAGGLVVLTYDSGTTSWY